MDVTKPNAGFFWKTFFVVLAATGTVLTAAYFGFQIGTKQETQKTKAYEKSKYIESSGANNQSITEDNNEQIITGSIPTSQIQTSGDKSPVIVGNKGKIDVD